jgi:hypothetical protein
MRTFAIAVLAVLLIFAAACGSVSPRPAAASPTGDAALNVRGTIDRSFTPACPTDEPCDPPITAHYLVFSQPGKPDVRAQVDGSGVFAVHLDPGVWTISGAPPALGGHIEPGEVRVPTNGTVELQLRIVRTPA